MDFEVRQVYYKIKRGISAAANVLLFASAYYCLMV